MLLQVLNNELLKDCHLELYSYWVKKRVLVYEYGQNGKIKLSVEPMDEQGALLDFSVGKCEFNKRFGDCPEAIFLWKNRQMKLLRLFHVVAKPKIEPACIAQLKQAKQFFEQWADLLQQGLIVAHSQSETEQLTELQKIFDKVFIGQYDSYIGRDVEEFVKF